MYLLQFLFFAIILPRSLPHDSLHLLGFTRLDWSVHTDSHSDAEVHTELQVESVLLLLSQSESSPLLSDPALQSLDVQSLSSGKSSSTTSVGSYLTGGLDTRELRLTSVIVTILLLKP